MNVNENENKKSGKRPIAQEVMSGDILIRDCFRKQYALFILIGAMVFIYIFLGFQAQRQQHRLTDLQKEWRSKHFEQLTIEAQLTERTRQSTMNRELQAMGSELKENKKPVIHLPNGR